MAMGEALITTIGGIMVTIISVYGTRIARSKKNSITKEDINNHSLFATMYSWQIERVKTLTATDPKRTALMQTYALSLLNSYIADMREFTSNLSKDNPTLMAKIYLKLTQNAYEALYKSGIPDMYIQRVYEYTASLREGIFLEIEEIDQADITFFEKVYKMCSQVKFLVKTTLTGLPLITTRLNGDLTKVLEEWVPPCV